MKLRLPAGYHHTTNPSPNTLHIRKVLPCFGSRIEIVSDKRQHGQIIFGSGCVQLSLLLNYFVHLSEGLCRSIAWMPDFDFDEPLISYVSTGMMSIKISSNVVM